MTLNDPGAAGKSWCSLDLRGVGTRNRSKACQIQAWDLIGPLQEMDLLSCSGSWSCCVSWFLLIFAWWTGAQRTWIRGSRDPDPDPDAPSTPPPSVSRTRLGRTSTFPRQTARNQSVSLYRQTFSGLGVQTYKDPDSAGRLLLRFQTLIQSPRCLLCETRFTSAAVLGGHSGADSEPAELALLTRLPV